VEDLNEKPAAVWVLVAGVAFFAVFSATVFSLVAELLWNVVIADAFGLPRVSFWRMFAAIAIVTTLAQVVRVTWRNGD